MHSPSAFWEPWNVAVFQCMHATAASPTALIAVAVVLAEWPLFVAVGLTGWQLLRRRDRIGVIRAIAACVVAILIEALVSAFAFNPRPFAAGFGPAWVMHEANNSMPSTHVTLTLVMAITLAMRKQRWASAVVVVLAVVLAWARVYVGIHWPADMVGAKPHQPLKAAPARLELTGFIRGELYALLQSTERLRGTYAIGVRNKHLE